MTVAPELLRILLGIFALRLLWGSHTFLGLIKKQSKWVYPYTNLTEKEEELATGKHGAKLVEQSWFTKEVQGFAAAVLASTGRQASAYLHGQWCVPPATAESLQPFTNQNTTGLVTTSPGDIADPCLSCAIGRQNLTSWQNMPPAILLAVRSYCLTHYLAFWPLVKRQITGSVWNE